MSNNKFLQSFRKDEYFCPTFRMQLKAASEYIDNPEHCHMSSADIRICFRWIDDKRRKRTYYFRSKKIKEVDDECKCAVCGKETSTPITIMHNSMHRYVCMIFIFKYYYQL